MTLRQPQSTLFPYTTLFRSSKTVGTSGLPKWRIQTWLTATRAVSGCRGSVIHFARAERRPVLVVGRSEEHTSELQSQFHLVCRLLLEKKKDLNDRYVSSYDI